MQHFITESNWEHRAVIDQVAKQAGASLPKAKLTGLLIDESGWVKKGGGSVGVDHQYCGNVGKTANSQVAVFGCLCNDKYAALVDTMLYLPRSWTESPGRCDKAGIPYEERSFKTKPELATDIVRHQVELGVSFDYVGGDGLYGNNIAFARSIEDMSLVFMLDIHSTQQVYLEKPELHISECKSNRGRPPENLRASVPAISAREYLTRIIHQVLNRQ